MDNNNRRLKRGPKAFEQLELFRYDPDAFDSEGQGELFTEAEVRSAQR